MDSLQVLHISASYRPAYVYGGPVRSTSDLCKALAESGAHVTVLTTMANGAYELFVSKHKTYALDGVRVRYFRRWTGDHSHFSPALLWNVLVTCRKYTAVHIHSWWNLVSVLSACICRVMGVKTIVSLRGTMSDHTFQHGHSWYKIAFHNLIGKRLLRKSILHVTSEKEAQEAILAVPDTTVVTIPNLLQLQVDPSAMTKQTGDTLKLLYVGRIHPIKNLELLLTTMALAARNQIRCTLEIIGSGDRAYVRGLMQKYAHAQNVRWLGPIEGREKYHRMRSADVLVLLSHTENFGNVVIEALSQGTAVIVSNQVGISAYVKTHELGWVIEPEIDALTSTIATTTVDRTLLEIISNKAPELILNDFGAHALTRRYLDLYVSGIDRPAAHMLRVKSSSV